MVLALPAPCQDITSCTHCMFGQNLMLTINFYTVFWHLIDFLFCGGTGLGKSNAVINLIMAMQGCFAHIQIYTADPNEPLYRMLKEKLKDSLTIDEKRVEDNSY